jgi:DNA-directed RNA polymerase specialized sigma24 family protein
LGGARFWTNETERLNAFAAHRLRRHAWRGSAGELPAGAKTAEDYVQEAVLLILDGARRYESNSSPFAFVAGIIDSLIRGDALKYENRTKHELVETNEEAIAETLSVPGAEETLAMRELVERFKKRLPNDQCRWYVEVAAADPFATTRDIAETMHLPEPCVRNVAKTIRRRRGCWEGMLPPPRLR